MHFVSLSHYACIVKTAKCSFHDGAALLIGVGGVEDDEGAS